MAGTDLDVRPLGCLALGSGLLALLLALSWFLSPLAYLPALLALGLGLAARTLPVTRRLGTAAVALAVVAVVAATVTLAVIEW